jgi:peroxiredoxin
MKDRRLGIRIAAALALAAGIARADVAPQTVSLLKSCGDASDTVAALAPSDVVMVRYSMAGYSQVCYAVTATLDGKPVNGYLLGSTHPAVVEFEKEARTHVPQLPPPPPPPAPPKPAADPNAPKDPGRDSVPAMPLAFAGFKALDYRGRTVDLDRMRAPNVVLYFWSPMDRSSVKKADSLDYLYGQYRQNGVEIVGISATGANLKRMAGEHEIIWPQVIDSGGIAAQYHVDPNKPYLLLDRDRNVVAAVTSALELEPAMRQAIKERRGNNR